MSIDRKPDKETAWEVLKRLKGTVNGPSNLSSRSVPWEIRQIDRALQKQERLSLLLRHLILKRSSSQTRMILMRMPSGESWAEAFYLPGDLSPLASSMLTRLSERPLRICSTGHSGRPGLTQRVAQGQTLASLSSRRSEPTQD